MGIRDIPNIMSVGIVGGTAPLVCTWIVTRTGEITSPAYYVSLMALVGTAAALGVRLTTGRELE